MPEPLEMYMSKSNSKYRDERAAVAAQFIEPGSSVLDIGCGAMLIRKHLAPDVKYVGYDIVPELPETHVIDLDAHEFPSGHWDYVILLGVLPWIEEKAWVLRKARHSAKNLIVTRKDDRFDAQIEREGWIRSKSLPYVNPVEIRLYV